MLSCVLAGSSALLVGPAAAPVLRHASPVMQTTFEREQAYGTKAYTGGVVPTRKAPVKADSTILVQGGSLRTCCLLYTSDAADE